MRFFPKNQIINYLKILGISILVNYFLAEIGSDFLSKYYETSLLSILIALFAISISTLSSLAIKLTEIEKLYGGHFTDIILYLQSAVNEFLAIIIMIAILLSLKNSQLPLKIPNLSISIQILLTFLIILTFQIIYHSTKGLFRSLGLKSELESEDQIAAK